jgi:hypothetical protein
LGKIARGLAIPLDDILESGGNYSLLTLQMYGRPTELSSVMVLQYNPEVRSRSKCLDNSTDLYVVRKIRIAGSPAGGGKRKVGSWDLRDGRDRPPPGGHRRKRFFIFNLAPG